MKKVISTGLALLLILSGVIVAFAAESGSTIAAADTTTTSTASGTTASAVTIVPDMNFTGTPVQLSLDNAYKKMLADSTGARVADLNKQNANNIAQGYAESIQSLNKAKDSSYYDYDGNDKDMAKAAKAFSTTQGPKNYQAEINKLKSDTLGNYYKLKEMENQVSIAKDNLTLKEKLLSDTQLKFKLGTVSKNDVLKAEVDVNEAKDQMIEANNGLNTLKMGFNQFMGYSLMQNVTLTDTIKEIPLSTKSLTDSIAQALKNRNEIAEADYNLQMSKLNANKYKAYPHTSSKYLDAQMKILLAETAYKNKPLTIESDVRTKYMAMNEQYSKVQTGKKSVENSKETLRLTQLQYDTGMATLSNVQEVQLGYYKAQLSYSKTLLEYNLAINDYELSSGDGVTAASLVN
jgi:outer membrane protein TolC